jgi:hypothetical protein
MTLLAEFLPSTGLTSLATTTCEPSRPQMEIGTLMSSAADSHAKTSAPQEGSKGCPANALVFGTNTLASLASFDPGTSSWKTSQRSLLGGWMTFSERWPRSGMTRSGTLFRLQPLVPLTAESESGLWPTPIASDGTKCPSASLSRAVNPALRATFRTKPEGRMWPTPTTKANQMCPSMQSRGVACRNLRQDTNGGSLNPTWVEWLMGFPTGWTDFEDSGTPSSLKSSKSSGGRSLKRKKG